MDLGLGCAGDHTNILMGQTLSASAQTHSLALCVSLAQMQPSCLGHRKEDGKKDLSKKG